MSKKTSDFLQYTQELAKANTEEDVKSIYASHFGIKYNTADKHDLYTPQVLFEFKNDVNFAQLKIKAKVLAQTLYYVHRLKYGFTDKPIPTYLCMADRNEALLTETAIWKSFYTDIAERYDWDLAPSNPDANLIKDLSENIDLKKLHIYQITNHNEYEVFAQKLKTALDPQLQIGFADKKIITEDNFEDVFEYWNKIFGDSVRNGLKTSRYFVCDIQDGRTFYRKEESKVFFDFGAGDFRAKKILAKDYEYFWSIYERITNPDMMRGILAKVDRLTDEAMRRFHGEFFTPLKFAHKALDYLEKTLGKAWWKSGKYRLWDMAAGTGNLEYHLPTEALPYCYLSTLYKEDVEHCQRLFPQAKVFQYDYLNDDVGNVFAEGALPFGLTWKLPEGIRKDLQNPHLQWIILINPPFATSQTAGAKGESKKDVSDTIVRKLMHKEDLGEVSRELFAQFLYRIKREFKGKTAHLGLFSKLKYINANNDQKFRDKVFQFVFENGFMFSSANFAGTSKASQFPVGFLIWKLSQSKNIDTQEIDIDVFNADVEKTHKKHILIEHRDKFLSKWINRPAGIKIFPPVGSSINVKHDNKDARDRISNNFLGCLMCCGNDPQHQNFTALLSMPYVSAGGHSITPEIFEHSLVVHTVRRLPKADWLNDRDQFMQPNKPLSVEFVKDCIVWSLYSYSNETVAMQNVPYKKEVYQVENHFFPFLKSEIKQWKISDSDIVLTLTAGEDRYVAKWLQGKAFSVESNAVLEAGRAVWQYYFAQLNQLNTTKFKISTWDAGWWQVRNALTDQDLGLDLLETLKQKHQALKAKLLPDVYGYGFL